MSPQLKFLFIPVLVTMKMKCDFPSNKCSKKAKPEKACVSLLWKIGLSMLEIVFYLTFYHKCPILKEMNNVIIFSDLCFLFCLI